MCAISHQCNNTLPPLLIFITVSFANWYQLLLHCCLCHWNSTLSTQMFHVGELCAFEMSCLSLNMWWDAWDATVRISVVYTMWHTLALKYKSQQQMTKHNNLQNKTANGKYLFLIGQMHSVFLTEWKIGNCLLIMYLSLVMGVFSCSSDSVVYEL